MLWYGGKPLKQIEPKSQKNQQPNGANDDVVMLIDSDDEEQPQQLHPAQAEYESDDAECDPGQPYSPVIQHLDLCLNTEALHIAFPNVPPSSSLRRAESSPPILSQRIVFTAVCSDCSVRVITLPLAPPSIAQANRELPESQKRWGEEILVLPSHSGHSSAPNCVAITWTSRTAIEDVQTDSTKVYESDDEEVSRPSRTIPRGHTDKWDFIIASHSSDVTGILRVNRVEISSDHHLGLAAQAPYQTVYLSVPALDISFNPTLFPSGRHSQLLISDVKGTVRVYDPLRLSRHQPHSSRPGSANDSPKLGSWLASFPTPLPAQNSNPTALLKRKNILACSWVLRGRAIIVLLEDGEWGVWNLQSAEQSRNVRLRGGNAGTLTFALRGFIGTTTPSSNPQPADRKARGSRALAPMTPNTRKSKQEKLFSGLNTISHSGPLKGGILVDSTISQRSSEENVLLWYGNEIYTIPSFQAFWSRSSERGSSGFLHGSGVTRIEGLDTYNERILNAQYLPSNSTQRPGSSPGLLVASETRLLIQSVTQRPDVEKAMQLFRKEEEDALRQEGTNVAEKNADMHMLVHGDLDLDGVERLLEGLGNSRQEPSPTEMVSGGRRVGFAA